MTEEDENYRERLKAWERDLMRREASLADRQIMIDQRLYVVEGREKTVSQQVADKTFKVREEAFLDLWGLLDGLMTTAAGRKRLERLVKRQEKMRAGYRVSGPSARPLSPEAFRVVKKALREAELAERREKAVRAASAKRDAG